MAYNLQPLITILQQILDPQQTCFIHDDHKPQLKSLLEKAISLQQILEKSPSLPNIEISLERQIRDAAHKEEDIIESHMVDRSLTEELMISFSSADLQQATQQLDSAMEQVVKLVESASSTHMVEFDEDMMELKDRLAGMQSKLEIIPIVGMGGRFPPSLRKLTLSDSVINSSMVITLCGLPNLEVLKIDKCKFDIDGSNEEEWEAREGEEFRSLQFLHFDNSKLVRWRANETNFPKLRHLLLEDCLRLEEIPSGIGEIPTLELIQMIKCSASAVVSAKQIVEVQHSDYDNYALQLRIRDGVDA